MRGFETMFHVKRAGWGLRSSHKTSQSAAVGRLGGIVASAWVGATWRAFPFTDLSRGAERQSVWASVGPAYGTPPPGRGSHTLACELGVSMRRMWLLVAAGSRELTESMSLSRSLPLFRSLSLSELRRAGDETGASRGRASPSPQRMAALGRCGLCHVRCESTIGRCVTLRT